ncbi:MAG: hypothetical protein LPK85_04170 [Gammaproteobacteria bacterium]|nr:hypothetical protein [Gammaproteobacteria bacterium]
MKVILKQLRTWMLVLGAVSAGLVQAQEAFVEPTTSFEAAEVYSVIPQSNTLVISELEYVLGATVQFDGQEIGTAEALKRLADLVGRPIHIQVQYVDGMRILRAVKSK